MKLRIAVCDDEKSEIEYLKMLSVKWAKEREIILNISVFESAESFLFIYDEDKTFDILLLDIQMKDMDGVELAKTVRKDNEAVQIVFITGFPDFIAQGYEVSALHYLMKPVGEEKLFEVLDRGKSILAKPAKSIFINVNGESVRLLASEIMCVEAQSHYVIITTPFMNYKSKMSLTEIQSMLGDGFFKCQRSFITGLKYVRRITKNAIILEGGIKVPLSRDLYIEANRAIIKYFP